ncbi:MAG: hypothetical protein WC059_02850 [Candidatus Paceibacterota bacterium]
MSDNRVLVYKKPGQTPLEAVTEAKNTYPNWKHVPVTYAGRLDPLAEGALLLLAGEECLKKDEYLALSKEYELSILFGFSTDTYDLMGLITESTFLPEDTSFISNLEKITPQFTGRIRQTYPVYSSRTVDGKPLFQWAREGKLHEITIPSHDVFVESIEVVSHGEIDHGVLVKRIHTDIARVHGDFRQEEIISLWNKTLENYQGKTFPVVTLRIKCGSGVYVRALAHDIGKSLGVPALALKIIRTKIGEFSVL